MLQLLTHRTVKMEIVNSENVDVANALIIDDLTLTEVDNELEISLGKVWVN